MSWFPDDITEYQMHFCSDSCSIHFLPCPLCGCDYEASANLLLWFQSWAMLPVAHLCSISSVYNCKGKLVSYPEVPLTALINSGINFSTGRCSVWAEESRMDSVFDILHGDSLLPITFPKQCWTNYLFQLFLLTAPLSCRPFLRFYNVNKTENQWLFTAE